MRNVRDTRQLLPGHVAHAAHAAHGGPGGYALHRESPKVCGRRPLITMRGPTLGSLEGEVELLRADA